MINKAIALKKIERVTQKKLNKFGREWEAEARRKSPVGPTGQLQRTLRVTQTNNSTADADRTYQKEEIGLSLSANKGRGQDADYPLEVAQLDLFHVEKAIIGRKGFHHFGKGQNREERYESGRKLLIRGEGRAKGAKYQSNYPKEAFIIIGGERRLKAVLRGAS